MGETFQRGQDTLGWTRENWKFSCFPVSLIPTFQHTWKYCRLLNWKKANVFWIVGVFSFSRWSQKKTLYHINVVFCSFIRTILSLCLRSEAKSKTVSTSLRWTVAWPVLQRSPTSVWVLSYLSREYFFPYWSRPSFPSYTPNFWVVYRHKLYMCLL